jgi:hypothetical protein
VQLAWTARMEAHVTFRKRFFNGTTVAGLRALALRLSRPVSALLSVRALLEVPAPARTVPPVHSPDA